MPTHAAKPFDSEALRSDFPILKTKTKGGPLAYFDSAATAQKPSSVIEAIHRFYSQENASIHRGIYDLASEATLSLRKSP